jgi:hypothetical protein
MRYLHADYVRRAATSAAHALMAPMVLKRAEALARGRVPRGLERRTARYLAVVALGVPVMHVANAVGDKRSRIRGALAHVEDLRDDAAFDSLMDQLASEVCAC